MTAPTQAIIERCLRAATRAGLPVSGFELRPDGAIRILSGSLDEVPAGDAEGWFAKDAAAQGQEQG